MKIFYWSILLCCISNCQVNQHKANNPLESNLKAAGRNRAELEKVLIYFSQNPKDSLKYQAAVLLISNMENYYHYGGEWPARFDALFFDRVSELNNDGIRKLRDSIETEIGRPVNQKIEILSDLQHTTSSYLINNIEQAYTSWQEAPWASDVSFDSFCNYILPYKAKTEQTENWRTLLKDRYRHILVDPHIPKTMEDICCAIIDEQCSWFHWTGRLGYFPGVLSITQVLRTKKGSCNEMANLGAYSARALGIPVAIDFTPLYGNDNDAHSWNALMVSDSVFIPFVGGESRPGDMALTGELEQKFAKVFRQQAGWVSSGFTAQALRKGITDLPEFLTDPRIRDVTASYTAVSDIRLSIRAKQGIPVYLCVFKRRAWVAIAGGFIKDNSVTFPVMGRGLVYLPMFYSGGSYEVAGPPVLLAPNGQMTKLNIENGPRKTLQLFRKYPFKKRWAKDLTQHMAGARIEGSRNPDFLHPSVLYQIPVPKPKYMPQLINDLEIKDRGSYDSCWNEIRLITPARFQYLRLVFDRNQPFRAGEIEFYDYDSHNPLSGLPIGNIPEPRLAFDGFPGHCIRIRRDTSKMLWAGLDLGQEKTVDRIRYIPDPDRNAVADGKTYELYYWHNKWVSAGVQKGTGLPLKYQDVPSGGVYWLNCSDCDSNEERIFTYEDGIQMFW